MNPSGDLLTFVNPLQGTDSHYGFSTGNTLPLTALPFAMNHWSPQTAEGSWFFIPRDRKLQGIRCTHQPSPWIGDYGSFLIMPFVGPLITNRANRASAYRLDQATVKPHHFAARLIRYGIDLEMSPTERGAIFQFHFPPDEPHAGGEAGLVIQPTRGESYVEILPGGKIVGWTRGNNGGSLDNFAHYFVAIFDAEPTSHTLFTPDKTIEGTGHTADQAAIALRFKADSTVTMRIATSFISIEQAWHNLETELANHDFATIKAHAAVTWEEALARIEIEATEAEKQTFYSCFYRTHLFPRVFHEFDVNGQPIHYSPYDGKVHPGVLYTDNGFWDTYRTMYPLLALTMPERLAEILQGWVNAYKEGGWFPQWVSPGYRACMVGTHIDAVFADGLARGITNFDRATALEGLLKHANTPGDPNGAFGRIGIEDYRRLGYVPCDLHHESLARSLDYAFDDFCIAQVASHLGKADIAQEFLSHAKTYKNSFDPSVGFMRGKNNDGSWLTPWREFQWGSPYVEGGPWQSSWAVQHDPAGLINLMGGDQAFAAKLDQMLTLEPKFEIGVYGTEIHEMTEMAVADFGQYAHSNQPVHHVLYLYNAAGHPWRTQAEVRRVMKTLYTPTLQPGDEDNGEMSAWYVLSSLGLFPLTPGLPTWTLGSPLFKKATVKLPAGKELIIEAPANSEKAVYVHQVSLNGTTHESLELNHQSIAQGAHLHFQMSETPTKTLTPAQNRPQSLSDYQ